jgi:hypothetical protein
MAESIPPYTLFNWLMFPTKEETSEVNFSESSIEELNLSIRLF